MLLWKRTRGQLPGNAMRHYGALVAPERRSPVKGRERADVLVVERGLADSRARAQRLILAGQVWSGERRIEKSGELIARDTPLELRGGERFVSRGGDKLDGALEALGVDVLGATCADIGASTGGFTDCLLQRGARRVFAIDVGHGQLADKLRRDPRVVVLERTNARYLERATLGDAVDVVVVDASFIGLEKLLPGILAVLRDGGTLVALVKPQFEAGRDEAARSRGVIRDPNVRNAAIAKARDAIVTAGFEVLGEIDSSLKGPKGNQEHFVYARRSAH
jgi:23S rRNA (cytidine1920-2'-O)/16S rRNA (cytidine1409-2'-O)-methyltransferase